MAMADIKQHEQDCFIYPIPGSIPEPPSHAGMKLRDGLKLAKALGCRIRVVNSVDLAISHPELAKHFDFPRPGVAVSTTRDNFHTGAVSFLRKVYEATVAYYAAKYAGKAQPVLAGGIESVPASFDPAIKLIGINGHQHPKPSDNLRAAAEEAKTVYDMPSIKPVIERKDDEKRFREAVESLRRDTQAAVRYFRSLAHQLYYQSRPDSILEFVPFEEAKNEATEKVRLLLHNMEHSVDRMAATAETVFDALSKQLVDALEFATRPREEPKVEEPEPEEQASGPAPRFFDMLPTEDMPENEKRWHIERALGRMLNEVGQYWHGPYFDRAKEVIRRVVANNRYSLDFVNRIADCDLGAYQDEITSTVLPGRVRAGLGGGNWSKFQAACRKAREKAPKAAA